MIDLIIPYYNNPEGLTRTLDSIQPGLFNIYVVDDHSMDSLPIIFHQYTYARLNRNLGPGCARQYGIDNTTSPYIMFIDTGDVFVSKKIQQEIVDTIKKNPEVNLFSYLYYHKGELTNHLDNRLHGKIYKRSFLETYGIHFCEKCSYLNEDIGFNMACRIIINEMNLLQMRIDEPIIDQIRDENSLTQHDDRVSLYRDQTEALSINAIHAIEICEKNDIDIQNIINQIVFALYYWFIRTVAERPRYIKDAWQGARIFYLHYKDKIISNQIVMGNAFLKKCITYKDKIPFTINILRFKYDIIENELPSDQYLGG